MSPLHHRSESVTTHPGNIYGDGRHLTKIEKNVEWTRT
jgi:hypothetical protein